jgi:hypothetical protein
VVYVTLGAPAGGVTNYWTLLDVSCRAAAGKTSENDLVRDSYPPFVSAVGDGKGIKRKRDNQELRYWFFGRNTPQVFDTAALLSNTDGTGRCGSWARFLIDMHKVHGITSSAVIKVVPTASVLAAEPGCEFMIQNGSFIENGTKSAPFHACGSGGVREESRTAGHRKVESAGSLPGPCVSGSRSRYL